MDDSAWVRFWQEARNVVHLAQECIRTKHYYPDEVETHIARLEKVRYVFNMCVKCTNRMIKLTRTDSSDSHLLS
jgi:hypothetical protein